MDVDTIASVSTAPGVGAIAVVRVSGPDSTSILMRIAPGLEEPPPPRVATVAALHDPTSGEALDEALVTYFRGPGSYTGEDLVELSCHGGWLVSTIVLEACISGGARRAEPGEFTKRAYLNGKLDLIQVEAVADLIEARSLALHRAAISQLDRGLSQRIAELRGSIVQVEALLAHHIDFPEEDDPPVPLERIEEHAAEIIGRLDRMLVTAPEGELLRRGALVVLAGRPNVGKSSLYNALVGQERAIVTDQPGTTRDALEAEIQLGGFPFRLVDTAGLRATEERVERLGIEVTHRYLERADLVLLCVEAAHGVSELEREFVETVRTVPVVLVETKADVAGSGPQGPPHAHEVPVSGVVRVSSVTGSGLGRVRALLPSLVYSGLVTAEAGAPVLTRRRHARALELARSELQAFSRGLADGLPAEVAASHLRPAETALEEVLGIISVEDVLDVVFRDFCVGK